LLFLEPPGGTYWSSKVEFLRRELLVYGYIDAADLDLFRIVQSAQDAIDRIDQFYRRYHSMRYVGGRLVLRLQEALPARRVERLQAEFSDLLLPQGRITRATALPEEASETHLRHLQRLIVDFNRRHFGRLRHLIDAINA
jgi:hypothetical protein